VRAFDNRDAASPLAKVLNDSLRVEIFFGSLFINAVSRASETNDQRLKSMSSSLWSE
jgi:hypothetical protein